MKKTWLKIVLGTVLAATAWFGYAAWRASKDTVTIDVRNADVKDVVARIERQTWETIYVRGDISGKVTLNVKNAPLESVLEIISEQTNARWSALYPLYSSSKTLSFLKRSLAGEDIQPPNVWTNLNRGPSFRGGFMNVAQDQNNLVSVKIEHKDLTTAARAVSRYTRGEIIPENGSFSVINLDLNQATVSEAVAALAKQSNKDWTKLYVLRGWGRDGDRDRGRREMTGDDDNDGRRERRRRDGTNEVLFASADGTNDVNSTNGPPWERPGFREEMERRFQEQLATMSPEERKRAEEMRKQFQDMRNMTPEQRQERMKQMASSPEFQQRAQQRERQRLQNSTPEQRVERTRRVEEAKQNGGSPGGRGFGPRIGGR